MNLIGDKTKYILAGCWNTLFGFGVGVGLYKLMSPNVNTVLIGVFTNFIAIAMSFFVYKKYVFRSEGDWLFEYCRCNLTYGGTAVLGVFNFWFFIEILHFNVWTAQILLMVLNAIITFVLHKNFTFKLDFDKNR